jgi:hypothetical protein
MGDPRLVTKDPFRNVANFDVFVLSPVIIALFYPVRSTNASRISSTHTAIVASS